jgi:hypothetical protein
MPRPVFAAWMRQPEGWNYKAKKEAAHAPRPGKPGA